MIHVVQVNNPFCPWQGYKVTDLTEASSMWDLFRQLGFTAFDYKLVATIDKRHLPEEAWDKPIPAGSVVGIAPNIEGGFVAIIVVALIAVAAIAIALSLTVPVPNSPKISEPDPVFSLKGQTNQIKLGSAIEAGFGQVRHWPSYGAKPYNQYLNNEAYQFALFCCGQGAWDISQLYIEDTPIEDFQDAEYEIIQPNGTTTLFRDNVQTSSEVGSQELYGPNEPEFDDWFVAVANDAGTTTNLIEVDVTLPRGLYRQNKKGKLRNQTVTAQFQYMEIDNAGNEIGTWTTLVNVTKTLRTVNPKRYTYSASVPYGRYKVRGKRTNNASDNHTVGDTLVWETLRAFLPNVGVYGDVTMIALKIRATANLNDQSKRKINFRGTRKLPIFQPAYEGEDIFYVELENAIDKIVIPWAGVISAGEYYYVRLQVYGQAGTAIGTTVTSLGESIVGTSLGEIQQTNVWETVELTVSLFDQEDDPGAFVNLRFPSYPVTSNVRIRDIELLDTNRNRVDHWAFDNNINGSMDGEILASDSGNLDGVFTGCTGVADFSTPATWSEPTATRNPIWAFCEIFRSAYGANLTDEVLDLTSLSTLAADLEAEEKWFDWVFDSETTVWEAAKTIARSFRGIPLLDGSQIYIEVDKPKLSVQHLFNAENIVADSLTLDSSLYKLEEYDSIEVEYTDAETWKVETVICGLPDSFLENPEVITLAGVTDRNRAFHEGMYMLSMKKKARQQVVFRTGLEGLIATYGDLIKVEFDTFGMDGTTGGFVTAISGDRLTLQLSRPVLFEVGYDYRLMVRGKDGTPYGPYIVTAGSHSQEIISDTAISANVVYGDTLDDPIFVFGRSVSFAKDCVITGLRPYDNDTVEIKAIVYNSSVYDYDATDAPDIYNPSSLPADPSLPVVTGVDVVAVGGDTYKIYWSAAIGATSYVVQISPDDLPIDDPDKEWETVGETTATFFETTILSEYAYIRVAGINTGAGPWAYHEELIEGNTRITYDLDTRVTYSGNRRTTYP